MMQAIFDRVSKHGLTDWAVVLQGVNGIPVCSDRLPPSCVGKFSTAELEKAAGDDPLLAVIVGWANDGDLSASELCTYLQKSCESKSLDIQRAKRIWRAVALEDVLTSLDSDPLYGLIKLSNFWASWEWPGDASCSEALVRT